MQEINPRTAQPGTLQELHGADLSARAVLSGELGTRAPRPPAAPGQAPTRTRQHLAWPDGFQQGTIHPQHPPSPGGGSPCPAASPTPPRIAAGQAAGATTPRRWPQPGPLGRRGRWVTHATLAASHAPARPAQRRGGPCRLLIAANSQVFLVL